MTYSLASKRVFVAGHRGMVGQALVRALEARSAAPLTATRAELDLTNQAAVRQWMRVHRPQAVLLAAAKVGGILANASYPADFLAENLAIELNVIQAAHEAGVEKLLFLGSSCIYPKHAPQPIPESALLTGPLEPTNEAYAIAKIAGLMLCRFYRAQYGADFISAMPTNLYGPGDNFDPRGSHMAPALMRRMHEAKLAGAPSVTIWGTGTPTRELMHVDDCAQALLFLAENYSGEEHINVGTGVEHTVAEIARLVASAVGYQGGFIFDKSKPDGTPRKCSDIGKLAGLGWRSSIALSDGLQSTYAWYLEQLKSGLEIRNQQFV